MDNNITSHQMKVGQSVIILLKYFFTNFFIYSLTLFLVSRQPTGGSATKLVIQYGNGEGNFSDVIEGMFKPRDFDFSFIFVAFMITTFLITALNLYFLKKGVFLGKFKAKSDNLEKLSVISDFVFSSLAIIFALTIIAGGVLNFPNGDLEKSVYSSILYLVPFSGALKIAIKFHSNPTSIKHNRELEKGNHDK